MSSRKTWGIVVVTALCCAFFAGSAAAATTTVATVQAEQMQLPPGAGVVSDSSASGGQVVQLTITGSSLTSILTLPAAATGIEVVAHGTRCQRGWPGMQVSMDGTALTSVSVSASSWQTYTGSASLAAGSHTLAITDTAAKACRILSIDDAVFTGVLAPTPTVALMATPASISGGTSSTLQWSAANATACTASGSWSGSEPVSGSAATAALLANATYSLTCTGAGGSASASTTVAVAPSAPEVCQSVAIPAYFYPSPAGPWSAAAAAPGVGMMVANVANGPGATVNSDYATAISQARAAGIKVFGYVYTDYGGLSPSTVETAINGWRTLYGVTSIFLDQASTSGSQLSYYQSLSNYVHTAGAGAQTIVNFGTIPSQSEMSAGDILITFEGSYSSYGSTHFPPWMASYAPSRFYNIVYQVPDQLSMLNVLREAASAGVGQVYATNDGLPNPYDTLPPYLTGEVTQAHSGC